MSSFAKRRIDVQFKLGTGSFGADGADTLDLSGLRCSATITKAGPGTGDSLDLVIYGMKLETMNKLTVLNVLQYADGRMNTVTVSAGDDDSGVAVVFVGNIVEAWADMHGMPDVLFHVAAQTGIIESLKPIPPTSYRGSVDVATIMAGLAAQMGLGFENSGVSVQIADPYLSGTGLEQAKTAARAADINAVIDGPTLAIWPKGKSRGDQIVEISPESGLVGYPTFTQNAILVQSLYNPSITPGASVGKMVKVTSSLEQASKTMQVVKVVHNLDSETPDGQWFTRLDCAITGQETPVPSG